MKLEEQCPRQQANHAKQYSELPTEYSSLRIGRLAREGVDGRRIQDLPMQGVDKSTFSNRKSTYPMYAKVDLL